MTEGRDKTGKFSHGNSGRPAGSKNKNPLADHKLGKRLQSLLDMYFDEISTPAGEASLRAAMIAAPLEYLGRVVLPIVKLLPAHFQEDTASEALRVNMNQSDDDDGDAVVMMRGIVDLLVLRAGADLATIILEGMD